MRNNDSQGTFQEILLGTKRAGSVRDARNRISGNPTRKVGDSGRRDLAGTVDLQSLTEKELKELSCQIEQELNHRSGTDLEHEYLYDEIRSMLVPRFGPARSFEVRPWKALSNTQRGKFSKAWEALAKQKSIENDVWIKLICEATVSVMGGLDSVSFQDLILAMSLAPDQVQDMYPNYGPEGLKFLEQIIKKQDKR